jgi:N-acetyl-D-muramate 6-phosphate phosphatase
VSAAGARPPSLPTLPTRSLAAVLLDLDGTLLDSAPDLTHALNALRAECGLSPLALAVVRPHVSHGSGAVVRIGFPDVGAAQFEALRARFLTHYRANLLIETRLFDGFAQVLDALDAHRVPWGIVTNKPGWLTTPLLAAMGLDRRAGCVVSGDSLPVRKPDPLPLLRAAQMLHVAAADCCYVGDALRDAQAAQAAGMVALGARYGYIGVHEEPDTWPVTAWLQEPLELLGWVGLASHAPEPGSARDLPR